MCFQFGGDQQHLRQGRRLHLRLRVRLLGPRDHGGKSTSFTCTADFGSGDKHPAPDGPVWACMLIAADAAIPDNPAGPNQSASAGRKANLSDAKCDSVLLDRAAPQVVDPRRPPPRPSRPARGRSESQAAATRPRASPAAWTGASATTRPREPSRARRRSTRSRSTGTYEVKAKTSDAAGNPGHPRRRLITGERRRRRAVAGANRPRWGRHHDAAREAAGHGRRRRPSKARSNGTAPGRGRPFEVSAPRKLKLAKGKLPDHAPRATPPARSASRWSATAGSSPAARRRLRRAPRCLQVKLPRKAKAGRYTLKVTFKPTGGEAINESLKVKLIGKRAGQARRPPRPASPKARVSGRTPAGLPDGQFHGTRKRTFAPRGRVAA